MRSYKFKFDSMFGMDCTQDDVFDSVARDAVDAALDGYNSTIFAYGQTGMYCACIHALGGAG